MTWSVGSDQGRIVGTNISHILEAIVLCNALLKRKLLAQMKEGSHIFLGQGCLE